MTGLLAVVAIGIVGVALVVQRQRREDAQPARVRSENDRKRRLQSLRFSQVASGTTAAMSILSLALQYWLAALLLALAAAISLSTMFYLQWLLRHR